MHFSSPFPHPSGRMSIQTSLVFATECDQKPLIEQNKCLQLQAFLFSAGIKLAFLLQFSLSTLELAASSMFPLTYPRSICLMYPHILLQSALIIKPDYFALPQVSAVGTTGSSHVTTKYKILHFPGFHPALENLVAVTQYPQ